MNIRLDGKVALVTGANRGIGLAIAEGFAEDGASLGMAARDAAKLHAEAERLARTYNVRTLPVVSDLGRLEDATRFVRACAESLGRIDILVNAAGDVPSSPPLQSSEDDWENGLSVKLLGYVRCAREAVSFMQRAGGGSIVHIVSISGREPVGASGVPGAVNAALLNLTKTMADELAPAGIRVNAVNPGFTQTARMERHTAAMAHAQGISHDELKRRILSTIPLGRFGQAMDVANMVRFLVSDAASYITGVAVNVDGGFSRGAF